MNKKARKLVTRFNTQAAQLAQGYIELELPRIHRKAKIDSLLMMHARGELKGTKIGHMIDRNNFPWEGDKPEPLLAHMFELEEILV